MAGNTDKSKHIPNKAGLAIGPLGLIIKQGCARLRVFRSIQKLPKAEHA
jgi:hypothetical protein